MCYKCLNVLAPVVCRYHDLDMLHMCERICYREVPLSRPRCVANAWTNVLLFPLCAAIPISLCHNFVKSLAECRYHDLDVLQMCKMICPFMRRYRALDVLHMFKNICPRDVPLPWLRCSPNMWKKHVFPWSTPSKCTYQDKHAKTW